MGSTKNALARYQVINLCFINRTKRYWSAQDLLAKLESCDILISQRTLELDFEVMRHDTRLAYRAPIEYCHRNKGYYYTDPDYSITSLKLDEQEIEMLFEMKAFVRPFGSIMNIESYPMLMRKLASHTGLLSGETAELAQPDLHFDGDAVEEYSDIFKMVRLASRKKATLHIRLRPTSGQWSRDLYLRPIYLAEKDKHWMIIGSMPYRSNFYFVRVEHILTVALSSQLFLSFEKEDDE